MPGCIDLSNKLSFFAWNINGPSSKSIGDKLRYTDFSKHEKFIKNVHFIILSETLKRVNVDVDDLNCLENRKICLQLGWFRFSSRLDFSAKLKESPNFLWLKIRKECTKTGKDFYVCGA